VDASGVILVGSRGWKAAPDLETRGRRPALAAVARLTALAVALAPGLAAAQERPTLSGAWTASALTEAWTVSEWGEACGPKPPPRGAGGGAVQIREQGGELSIVGAGRAFSTAECWEQMPGLARTSHSQSGGGRFWRTRCSSPANDPRRATVVTTIQATDSSISLNETGQYQFIIQNTTCTASVTRSRSYSLVRRDGDTPPEPSASASASAAPSASAKAPPPEPPPRPAARCTGPAGEPARLEVNPSRKLLRAGERFAFRAVVLDDSGCPTGARATWAIVPGPLAAKATVDTGGAVTVASDAGEGKIDLTASALGKSVTVSIEVARPEDYDALLASRGLNAAGEQEEAAVAVIATGTIGGRTAIAEDAARERKFTFVAIVVALAALLGFAGLVLARRGRRTEAAAPPGDPPFDERDPPATGATGGEAQPTPAAPGTGSPSSPGASPPTQALPPLPLPGAPAARRAKKPAERGKICPICGERYGAEAMFCGKDATKLVLLN
jgi:hypothetical protein